MAQGTIRDTQLRTISTAGKVALSALEIDGGTALSGALAGADLFIMDDGASGANKKVTAATMQDFFSKVDVTATDSNTAFPIVISAGGDGADLLFDAELTYNPNSDTLVVANMAPAAAFDLDAAGAITIDGSSITLGGDADTAFDFDTSTFDIDSSGLITIDGSAGMTINSTSTSVAASLSHVGAAGVDLTIDASASSLNLFGGEAHASAVKIQADNAAGGIDVDAGTGGIAIDTTGAFAVAGAAASSISVASGEADENLTLSVTGATASSLILSSAGTGTDAVDINATAGGIDIDAAGAIAMNAVGVAIDGGNGEIDLTTTGALDLNGAAVTIDGSSGVSIDGAGASNMTTSSGALTLDGATGVNIEGNAGEIDITTTGNLDLNGAGVTIDASTTVAINGGSSSAMTLAAGMGSVDISQSTKMTTIKGTFNVDEAATFDSTVAIAGNLTVNGTTTTVNSTTVTVDDPIITLGGDSAPSSETTKDRGVEFRYHDGSSAKVGFMGWDDSADGFTLLHTATNTSEVFSGTAAPLVMGALTASTVAGSTGTFSGRLVTDDTTDATSKTDGSLQTDGGLSVAKKIYSGTDVVLAADSGTVTMGAATAAVVSAAGIINVNNATDTSSKTTGSLQTDGGLGVAKKAYVGTGLTVEAGGVTVTAGGIEVDAGAVNIDDTTAASSKTTGALKVAGGISAQLKGHFGTGLTTDSGGLTVTAGGVEVSAGRVLIDDTTGATSTTDGALAVAGGVSIAESAVIGDDLDLLSDGAILSFGASQDIKMTHEDTSSTSLGADIKSSAGASSINDATLSTSSSTIQFFGLGSDVKDNESEVDFPSFQVSRLSNSSLSSSTSSLTFNPEVGTSIAAGTKVKFTTSGGNTLTFSFNSNVSSGDTSASVTNTAGSDVFAPSSISQTKKLLSSFKSALETGHNSSGYSTSTSSLQFDTADHASAFQTAVGSGATVRFASSSSSIDFTLGSYSSGTSITISSATQVSGSSVSHSALSSIKAVSTSSSAAASAADTFATASGVKSAAGVKLRFSDGSRVIDFTFGQYSSGTSLSITAQDSVSGSGNLTVATLLSGGSVKVVTTTPLHELNVTETFDIVDHDGSSKGLKLNNTLVTSTAAELNLLDAGSAGSSVALASGDAFVIGDADASNASKKVLLSDLATLLSGAGLTQSGATLSINVVRDSFEQGDATSGSTVCALTAEPVSQDSVDVYLNGVLQIDADEGPSDSDYTYGGSAGSRTITLASAMITEDIVTIKYIAKSE